MDKRKILKPVLLTAGTIAGIWVFCALLLPLFLPFFVAFILAAATEPAALYLMKKTGLRRSLASGLCILAAYLLLTGAIFLLGRTLLREAGGFVAGLPDAVQKLETPVVRLKNTLSNLTRELPDGVQGTVNDLVDDFWKGSSGLAGQIPGKMLTLVTKTAGRLPNFFLAVVTTVLASFMIAANLPDLRQWLRKRLPQPWLRRVTGVWRRCRLAVGGWILAELKLGGVTFLLVTLGLMLLRLPYPLLFGLLVAVVDVLPVLGSGTMLIPWALLLFLRGQPVTGTGMLLLYGTAAIVRTVLEPRFLGRQMGLPPLLTLVSVYTGYRIAGIPGLLLMPLLVSVAFQIFGRSRRAAA